MITVRAAVNCSQDFYDPPTYFEAEIDTALATRIRELHEAAVSLSVSNIRDSNFQPDFFVGDVDDFVAAGGVETSPLDAVPEAAPWEGQVVGSMLVVWADGDFHWRCLLRETDIELTSPFLSIKEVLSSFDE